MAISFTCAHCQKVIRVTDKQAGKKGPCPYCRKAIVVPMQSTQSAAKAKVGSAELEALAIDVVAEKPPQQEESSFIDYTCPYCDTQNQYPVSQGGKNAPCKECKRVLKVPMPTKTGPRDWRKPEAPTVPSGAKQAATPADSWGAQPAAAKVSRQALVAAKVIKEERARWTIGQWITRGSAAAVFLVVVVSLVLWYMSFRQGKLEERAFALADKTEKESHKKPPGWPAELQTQYQTYLSLYYHRSGKTDENGRGATVHLQLARQDAERISDTVERLGAIRELLRAMIELNTETEEVGAVVSLVVMPGPRQQFVREMTRQLLAGNQSAENLTTGAGKMRQIVQRGVPAQAMPVSAAADKDKLAPEAGAIDYAEQAACLSEVGLELAHLGQMDKAREVADAAANLVNTSKNAPLALLTLSLVVGKPVTQEGTDAELQQAAQVLAAARKNDLAKAQTLLDQGLKNSINLRLETVLELADALVQQNQNIEAVKWLQHAAQLLKDLDRDDTIWQRMRLLELMGSANFTEAERLLPSLLPANSPAAQRVRFEIFRWKAQYSAGNLDPDQIKTMTPSLGSASAAAFIYGRHLVRINPNDAMQWAEKVDPEPLRAFAALGTALSIAVQRR